MTTKKATKVARKPATKSAKKPATKPVKKPATKLAKKPATNGARSGPASGMAVAAAVVPVFTLEAFGTDALASYQVAYADVPKAVQKQCGSNAKKDKPNNRNLFYKCVVDGAPTYLYYFQYKPNKNDTTTGIDVFTEDGRSYGNGDVDDQNVLTWSLHLS